LQKLEVEIRLGSIWLF